MPSVEYKISFTTGGLYYREATQMARLFFDLGNWEKVSQAVRKDNLLKTRTQSSLNRAIWELIPRLRSLTPDQLQILVDSSRQEQNQILWLAVCKQYLFVYDFAVEVIREKLTLLNLEVTHLDFDIFYNAKAEWNEALNRITDSTRKKLRQVLFRILTEAEILSPSYKILPMILSPRVAEAVVRDDSSFLAIYPISEVEIRKYKNL